MAEDNLSYGEPVVVAWGLADVIGTVHEVYGPPARKHVVVKLTPELSGDVVDEPPSYRCPSTPCDVSNRPRK